MKIEDLKVGTKLKVIKPYRHNGIVFKEGEIIEVTKIILHFYGAISIKSQSYSNEVIIPSSFLFYCCEIIPSKVETKNINKPCTDESLHVNSVSSKAIDKPLYEVEVKLNFKNRRYTIGDFVRVKVNEANYYGKIKEINTATIRLTKLSSNNVYTIELDKIAEMENIG